MAVPRVFVSSTCYDLQEVRFQLKGFIESIGYDPVLSEVGDIFYDPSEHVQDACKNEIGKCNMFVLVVGNNYGSIYHRHSNIPGVPDSVTLQEFRKALESGVVKFIFVNRFVQYDYENYRRALDKVYSTYFSSKSVQDADVESTKAAIREEFDSKYHFPQEGYRYSFHFLDLIYSLKVNNAVLSFESFEDIKDLLRKQLAGLMYNSLERKNAVSAEAIEQLGGKIDAVEKQIRALVATQRKSEVDGSRVTIDLNQIISEFALEDLASIQEQISEIVDSVLYVNKSFGYKRLTFDDEWMPGQVLSWLESLGLLIQKLKWSKEVPLNELFAEAPVAFTHRDGDANVPYRAVVELYALYKRFDESDQLALANTLTQYFNEVFVAVYRNARPMHSDDDLPF